MTYYRNIALIGKAQAGKDTVASRLVERYGFRRVAFADPLKATALRIDPLIPTATGVHVRLSQLVADVGWDYAKTTYPEVRRILQHTGGAVRVLDKELWVCAGLDAVIAHEAASLPTVVTDVRYLNEATTLRRWGFTFVRVARPGRVDSSAAGRHASETELDNWATAHSVTNFGTLDELYAQVDALPQPRA